MSNIGNDEQGSASSTQERPIHTHENDNLNRGPFIRRLMDALISPVTKKSNGVVVGITGQWGSGKSSILNLLYESILDDDNYPEALVVRFDPWLVSGRNDLISQFFSELLSTINEKPSLKEKFSGIAVKFSSYGEALSPIVDFVAPGWIGKILGSGFSITKKSFSQDSSLHTQRKNLNDSLIKIDTPIVVFVDELDRVEDDEIRAVAQLVRSVMDFPNISYVLAYDVERVIQALGSGKDVNGIESRGRSYLEKIVQFQFPLPITLDQKLKQLLNAELRQLQPDLTLPVSWSDYPEYQGILDILIPDVIATLRDIKRLTGTYHVVRSAIGEEVDWIDLLGFSALLIKAPKFIERLKRNPQGIVEDPITQSAYTIRRGSDSTPEKRLELYASKPECEDGIVALLKHLFPAFQEIEFTDRVAHYSIFNRRPLLTALRFGLLPSDISKEVMAEIVHQQPSDLANSLKKLLENNGLDDFIEQLEGTYRDLGGINHELLWQGISQFLRKSDNQWAPSYSVMISVIRAFASLYLDDVRTGEKFQHYRKSVFYNFINDGDFELLTYILKAHVHEYGMLVWNQQTQSSKEMLLSQDEVKKYALKFSNEYKKMHLEQDWVMNLWSLQPVYMMIDTEVWDDACRDRMDEIIMDDVAFVSVVMMLYPPGYSIEVSRIRKIVTYEGFLERVKTRVLDADLQEIARVSFQLAI